MDEINAAIENLLEAIRGCDIYQEYIHQENLLSRDPNLKARVRAFRANNFRLQNEATDSELIAVVEGIYHESRELRKNPQVNAYLDAELAVCKMMQRISRKLCDGIEFDCPDI